MTHEKEIKDFIEANTPVIFGGAKWGGNRDTKLHKAIKAMHEENKKLKCANAELIEALGEALKLLYDDYTQDAMDEGYWPDMKPKLDKLNGVLEKAKGEKANE